MDSDKLSKALDFSNHRMTLSNQIRLLKSKMQTLRHFSINGGTFYIDRELISFCKMLIDLEYEEVILLDINELPIEIKDLESFLRDIISRYFEAVNEYSYEYQAIRKSRSPAEIIGEEKEPE